ncbi:chaperone for protein-folding within the ER, fungal-domain-containing protein [Cantharellus anzutake]|uniref:chaperone for protein-folding within the ER, fungal-domain-containing protein n=1 Tax=Cantharellus anzutake TaxID=1750568 RepID=UPI001904DA7C|nr:chaperone for protein-folding within the ER, fungal-domain-containing protein [Cantharellus anzutake]KAF8321978.1 chaperone for protein-folding within the ER, fungal-domain-containing protein [Cantharellus anzutake]
MVFISPLTAALPLFFSSIPELINAQADIHNVTPIGGTWSSGSGAVTTGAAFVNPLNFSFHYPKNAGIAWSFTEDGHFEQAEYQFNANGTQPNCITGVVLWQHGTYQWLSNGSIIANPIPIDGRMQVQNPCAAKSNVIQQFNTTILLQSWRIFQDVQRGPKLQLYRFDGAPLHPMYQIANPPNMLPTETLSVNLTLNPDGSITYNAATSRLKQLSLITLGTLGGFLAGALLLI